MSFLTALQSDLKKAMVAGDKVRTNAARSLIAAYNSVEKAAKDALNESDTVAIIKRQIKQREDSIKQYLDAGRKDLADIEQIELDYFKTHLPEMVTKEELEELLSRPDNGEYKSAEQILEEITKRLEEKRLKKAS